MVCVLRTHPIIPIILCLLTPHVFPCSPQGGHDDPPLSPSRTPVPLPRPAPTHTPTPPPCSSPLHTPELPPRPLWPPLAPQVNGKMRGTVEVGVDAEQDAALSAALELNTVKKFADGKEIKKVIYVPGKILNVITGK